ncbi:hypothetical protein, partial [Escherichia coli]|uniref:hypothetical protein n=1 Tax=Escherichia coli TaxID=562 RepID=UPI001AEBEAFD
ELDHPEATSRFGETVMLKGLLLAAITCGVSLPALAGERTSAHSRAGGAAKLVKDSPTRHPVALSSAASVPFMLPAGNARLER